MAPHVRAVSVRTSGIWKLAAPQVSHVTVVQVLAAGSHLRTGPGRGLAPSSG